MSARQSWFPGCGRPHPDIDLITKWANGEIDSIATTLRGSPIPVRQHYPSWNPTCNRYSDFNDRWARMFKPAVGRIVTLYAESKGEMSVIETEARTHSLVPLGDWQKVPPTDKNKPTKVPFSWLKTKTETSSGQHSLL